jgi:hypothetical protein
VSKRRWHWLKAITRVQLPDGSVSLAEVHWKENMAAELNPTPQEDQKIKMRYQGGSSDAVYGLGLIGAWVYYIGRATNFQEGVIGFFKGLFWPAFMVYELLKFLNKD